MMLTTLIVIPLVVILRTRDWLAPVTFYALRHIDYNRRDDYCLKAGVETYLHSLHG